ncbi:hypothetical protein Hanom_Chr09g00783041 [Helianthus anomalus]
MLLLHTHIKYWSIISSLLFFPSLQHINIYTLIRQTPSHIAQPTTTADHPLPLFIVTGDRRSELRRLLSSPVSKHYSPPSSIHITEHHHHRPVVVRRCDTERETERRKRSR